MRQKANEHRIETVRNRNTHPTMRVNVEGAERVRRGAIPFFNQLVRSIFTVAHGLWHRRWRVFDCFGDLHASGDREHDDQDEHDGTDQPLTG